MDEQSEQSNNIQSSSLECVETKGPWPFVTWRAYRAADQSRYNWSSRHHRKGLVRPVALKTIANGNSLLCCLWKPQELNWWIGVIFAIGSLLFIIGSVLCLSPKLATVWSLDSLQINTIFFAGSIPFTTAAYLQLFQAANAGESTDENSGSSRRLNILGWRPGDIGWLSSALQFIGTILFNFNTFDATLPSLDWFESNLLIWVPNIFGSILFLASGYLAFIEICHAYWAWNPKDVSWWVVFTNLLGCVGFMISAVFGIFLPGPANIDAATLSTTFTLLGAIGFFIGSLLMLPEMSTSTKSMTIVAQ
ncbi:hypothetical protein Pan54_24880 [Rubinisphaera italica]|uniref:YrhK domain-containing protein n=1 Tax=Rubinisphaera italica TaxID=2527969 RepID=A0A5C5XH52_9PLAN|nr:hypothetical protein Pan54_24880 [Rubinisphaera italica]